MNLFNRKLVRSFRNSSSRSFALHSFLFDEIVQVLLDKLSFFLINPCTSIVLNLGARNGSLLKLLIKEGIIKQESSVIQCDISDSMLESIDSSFRIVADEEFLPFAYESFDVITSAMSLHNVNNLLSVLSKINLLLKKGGIFIGTLFGSSTLIELKKSIIMAEIESCAVPRVLPFFTLQEVGEMLQKSGYSNPVIDVDVVKVSYKDIQNLFDDLKGMGESNVLNIYSRRPFKKKYIEKSFQFYKKYFSDDGVTIPATFEIITMSGLKI